MWLVNVYSARNNTRRLQHMYTNQSATHISIAKHTDVDVQLDGVTSRTHLRCVEEVNSIFQRSIHY